ncbi:ATP-binding cassette domain-containing protein [Pseudooceanicola sp. GBMRC 2024]|uniref:ATP-binding cassette domain-containing protein n=1 Tax=Pseudooceanicola albus TaxID=2692189 RepID=A0A6L7G582_9RHOB|nr:amino acid ABC transporter ATP-binding protein [Pseudooceanicola albus]MXN17803.1 ATP-binding cassette domain-containing protein [Pseudooceanicola albus]
MSQSPAPLVVAPLVVAHDLNKHYGHFHALKNINVAVERGEVMCIIGPSGSGKSTFLRCINQLETVSDGFLIVADEPVGFRVAGDRLIELDDRGIARQRLKTAMVFQRFNLFPHMSALENVMEGPVQVLRQPRARARAQAQALLERVGLGHRLDAYPSALSGGQQQRVAIARALAMEPEVLLFDEPTSALDPELVAEVLSVMRDLARSGMTMIIVTHELAFARDVASRVMFMDHGEVIEVGPPDQVLGAPQEARTRSFISAVRGAQD